MTNFKTIIIENRKNTKALSASTFEKDETFKSWKSDVEALRLVVSAYAVANRTNAMDEAITETTNDVFTAYNRVLAWFTNKALGEKLKAQATDLNSLLTMAGVSRKQAGSEDGKQFLPIGTTVFRKNIEDFLSDRLTSAACLTAEDVEAARKARNKAKAEAKKAKAKAEKEAGKTETVKKAA